MCPSFYPLPSLSQTWIKRFGICVIRSGFIPRILGVPLMIAGCGYVARSFARVVVPRFANAVHQVSQILNLRKLPIIFWLLIQGAKPQRVKLAAS